MNKEEQVLQKRFIELSKIAFCRDIPTYSDFLNLNELNILHMIPKDQLHTKYAVFGGYEYAERQMVVFLPDALCCNYRYPISILRILPLNKKFAEDLGHRDYLGALINLGIERSMLGDIAINESGAYLFCKETMAPFIADTLSKVRHTQVKVESVDSEEFEYVPKLTQVKGNVASVRLDAVLSAAFSIARNKVVGYIEGGKVFVNGKLITNNGYRLREMDIISIRGVGRIRYDGIISETKKGRYFISLSKYE